MRDVQTRATPSNARPQTRNEQVRNPWVLESMYCNPYCNRDGTARYAADIVNVRRRQKCCKTAELPDMPVRNEMGDAELTRRRSLVRTQHRPLLKVLYLQVKRADCWQG
jgi:hypothetical protein